MSSKVEEEDLLQPSQRKERDNCRIVYYTHVNPIWFLREYSALLRVDDKKLGEQITSSMEPIASWS
jgi:hypothetical protein